MILLHIHDERQRPPASRRLGGAWTVLAVPLEGATDIQSCEIRHCILDVDVTSLPKALSVRAISGRMERGATRLFACSRGDHHAVTQARALGATAIVDRPVPDRILLRHLAGIDGVDEPPASTVVGAIALDLVFHSIADEKPIAPGYVENVARSMSEDIRDIGIDSWLHSIRAHHAGTYQHCLIVTGLAAAFGQALGLSTADLEKLTVAALLHDIGKARIALVILDKRGSLTPEERAIIEMHPVWGAEHLERHGTVAPEIIECVHNHHEMLDGSGYPKGLRGGEISDLTRLLSIVDIFGALLERRSYKDPMSPDAAFAIVRRLAEDGKLEKALVEAFRPVVANLKEQAAQA